MTFIIHTKGFDMESPLQTFIETCLRMLLRLPVKISEVRVTLGEGDINIGKTKFCHLHLIAGDTNFNITRYGNSYEEAVLCSVKEMDEKIKK